MRRALTFVTAALGVLLMAPTVGDTGGCGRTVSELDHERYENARKIEDCQRCQECGVATERCLRACDPKALPEIILPATCRPLYHDGEVCLRAIAAARCTTFATYVDDLAPSSPGECNFCRVGPPEPPTGFGEGGIATDAAP